MTIDRAIQIVKWGQAHGLSNEEIREEVGIAMAEDGSAYEMDGGDEELWEAVEAALDEYPETLDTTFAGTPMQ